MADESEFQVAILLPVQGTDEALDRTVASVLAQTERRWTLWLIESEDARGRAARWLGTDPRVRRLPHAGGGRAAALGAALARCPGDYLVFLDAEHSWEPGFLALTTAFLRANPLEDLVCMEAVTPSGRPAVVRRAIFRERGALCAALDLPAGTTPDGALDGAVWYRGELAQHLRWGEYSRMAVTLMTSDAALRLAPALGRESAALEYRLQARLARTSAVNLLALRGAVQQPVAWSAAQELQQERAALEVFDEIHGPQREVDPEVARLRANVLRGSSDRRPCGCSGMASVWPAMPRARWCAPPACLVPTVRVAPPPWAWAGRRCITRADPDRSAAR